VVGTLHAEVPKSLGVLLATSMVLLIAWSFAIPIFEAPDENLHWQFARYLHEEARLPVFRPGFPEANSPPIYYALIAPFAWATETPEIFIRPDGLPGIVVAFDGTLHSTPSKAFRNRASDFDKYWPIRIARLMSALMGVGTVACSYLAGRAASGRSMTGLLAGSLVAFLPMFTFRATNVSNDTLVALLSALTLYLIVRIVKGGFNWPIGVGVGAAMAGAFLAKVNAMVLPFSLVLAVITERAAWRDRIVRLAGVLGLTLLVVLPWLLRNQVLYGDPLASRAMLSAVPTLVVRNAITSSYFTTIFPQVLSRSFVGVFGWANFYLPEWVYRSFLILAVVALGGLVRGLLAGRVDARLLLAVVAIPVLSLGIVVHINLSFFQPQGRYMLPALPAIALLAALGLEEVPGWSNRAALILSGGLCALNIYILTVLVIPGYWFAPDINM
jgi:4-amino-4-deoxy-L-arabinose transferase-like glycosyltransferase